MLSWFETSKVLKKEADTAGNLNLYQHLEPKFRVKLT